MEKQQRSTIICMLTTLASSKTGDRPQYHGARGSLSDSRWLSKAASSTIKCGCLRSSLHVVDITVKVEYGENRYSPAHNRVCFVNMTRKI